MEACAEAALLGTGIDQHGHDARLISPQFVKPNVKGNKNDAGSICEVVGGPTMPFVPVKCIEQQNIQMLHRAHSGLVKERVV